MAVGGPPRVAPVLSIHAVLPPFLAEEAGVNSCQLIAQYTQAAMVAENRGLAAPANVESLPTSAMREDHVSMVWAAACKPRRPTANLGLILAVELLRAARGLGPRGPLAPAAVRGPGPDRWLSRELAAVERLVVDGGLPPAVEAVAGSLA